MAPQDPEDPQEIINFHRNLKNSSHPCPNSENICGSSGSLGDHKCHQDFKKVLPPLSQLGAFIWLLYMDLEDPKENNKMSSQLSKFPLIPVLIQDIYMTTQDPEDPQEIINDMRTLKNSSHPCPNSENIYDSSKS